LLALTPATLSASPNSIGATSQISLTVSSSTKFTLPVGTSMIFQFPSAFINTSPTCSTTVNSFGFKSLPISFFKAFPTITLSPACSVSGNQITIKTSLSASQDYFSIPIVIGGFTNPSLISYSTYFNFKIVDSGGTIIAKIVDDTSQIALNRAKLKRNLESFTSKVNP